MTSPLNTDVMANETPVTVPTMPLARSRRSLGDEQRHARRHGDAAHLAGDRAEQREAGEHPEQRVAQLQQVGRRRRRRTRAVAAAKQTVVIVGRQHHRRLLAVAVDVRAERRAEDGGRDAEGAADDAGGDDRAGLEVHPERQGEPQERARHAADERVDEQAAERPLVAVRRRKPGRASGAVQHHRPDRRLIDRTSPRPSSRTRPIADGGSDGGRGRNSSPRGDTSSMQQARVRSRSTRARVGTAVTRSSNGAARVQAAIAVSVALSGAPGSGSRSGTRRPTRRAGCRGPACHRRRRAAARRAAGSTS